MLRLLLLSACLLAVAARWPDFMQMCDYAKTSIIHHQLDLTPGSFTRGIETVACFGLDQKDRWHYQRVNRCLLNSTICGDVLRCEALQLNKRYTDPTQTSYKEFVQFETDYKCNPPPKAKKKTKA